MRVSAITIMIKKWYLVLSYISGRNTISVVEIACQDSYFIIKYGVISDEFRPSIPASAEQYPDESPLELST